MLLEPSRSYRAAGRHRINHHHAINNPNNINNDNDNNQDNKDISHSNQDSKPIVKSSTMLVRPEPVVS